MVLLVWFDIERFNIYFLTEEWYKLECYTMICYLNLKKQSMQKQLLTSVL